MPAPKWFLIAKNQYRIYTSSVREIRPYFPFLVIGALAVFVFFIAPLIVNAFVDELVAFFLSQVAVVVVQVMLFMLFFLFVTLPITYALRDIKTEQQWLFISAPVKSSDILLGEYLGELPLYAILIVIVTGFFTAVLTPLKIDMIQKFIIVIVFVIILSSALWIGTVIAALLRTKLGKSARGRDMGKGLSVIIILPMVAVMYAFIGGGVLEALADPGTSGMIKTAFMIFPSTWGAKVITGLVSSPGNTGDAGFVTFALFGGLVLFFGATLWIGTRLADRAYSLEAGTFTTAKAKPDSVFYKTIRQLVGGGSFGTLLASTFKVYTRRLHNLSWLAYSVGIAALLNIFFVKGDDPFGVIMLSSFVFAMIAAIVASDVTIRGKETLFIYKKTPSGVGTLVKTRLIQGWFVVIPIVVAIMGIVVMLNPQVSIGSMALPIGLVMLIAAAYMAFALGLFLLMPAYTERGGEFVLNLMIIVQGAVFLFIACLILFGETRGLLLMALLSWLLGIVFLFLGKWRLSRME
ncbi:MAG: hypothetical protein HXS46_15295 [Theionarchaea archaeon]|nr:MAG: hypothetical protein AYK18_10015 [Theionarchaea archaeon DG-70]MBU7012048.1 hypothetical protein [Theionarchaea archaeon]